jgi:prepilin-type N-terminal cleavage/methylation domain-containing protein
MIWMRRKGFTLVEIMIVVAIIGLLAAIAIPNFIKARDTARKNACIANLKTVQGAIQVWAIDTNAAAGSTAPTLATLVSSGYLKSTPACPSGGAYNMGANIDDKPTCNVANHALP